MNVKLFEVRDRATLIPVMAIALEAANQNESWLLMNAGYGYSQAEHGEYILMGPINSGSGMMTCDPYKHTMEGLCLAHTHIIENWCMLERGDVIDLQFIRGETEKPCKSSRKQFFGGMEDDS